LLDNFNVNAAAAYFSGSVGIGTAVQADKLAINGSTRILGGNDLLLQASSSAPNDPGDLIFQAASGAELSRIFSDPNGSGSMKFSIGSIPNEKMVLAPSGNLGIGVTNPQGKMHIVENNNTASLILESNSAGWGSGMYFKNTAPNGKGYGIYTSSYGSFNIADVAAQVDRLFIGANGNVGVGTNLVSDVNYKFFVGGAIRARKVRVDQDVWTDYVFDKDYTLRPLVEVESFIKKYRHLPDVPSAADVKKEGIDLGENQAVLLKKIEELTLYLIEQNRQLAEQQKQIDAFRQERSDMKQLQLQFDELQKTVKHISK